VPFVDLSAKVDKSNKNLMANVSLKVGKIDKLKLSA